MVAQVIPTKRRDGIAVPIGEPVCIPGPTEIYRRGDVIKYYSKTSKGNKLAIVISVIPKDGSVSYRVRLATSNASGAREFKGGHRQLNAHSARIALVEAAPKGG